MKLFFGLIFGLMLSISIVFSQTQDAVINILHINDTHSNYSKGGSRDENLNGTNGGMAKATSVIGYSRMQDPEALLFHTGDFFMGDLHFYLNYGVPELLWMQMMGFNAAVIGNHEFDLTTAGLIQSLQYAYPDGGIPLLSANLTANTETGEMLKSILKDREIITVHGVKVGYFGITSPQANLTSLSLPDIFVEGESPEILMGIIAEQVAALKSDGAQMIIFLSHLGLDVDKAVAEMIPGIDIVIGGHDHFALDEPVKINGENGKKTYIVQAGAFFENVGTIQAEIKNGKLHKFDYQLVKLDENIPDEPTVQAMIDDLINSQDDNTKALFTQQIASVTGTLDELDLNLTQKGDHTTSVGSLIADAIRNYGQTDIGFTTGGLSAQPLYKGPVVIQDVAKMIGYGVNETNFIGYNLVTFDIYGAALKQGIAYCLSTIEANDDYFPQVSGMSYKYCLKNPEILEEILVNGVEISDNTLYSMTTNFVTYSILGFIGIPTENANILYDASEIFVVAEYIAGQGELSPLNNACRAVNVCKPRDDNKQGVNDSESLTNNLLVFPNPAKDAVNMEWSIEMPGVYSVDVFNLSNLEVTHLYNTYFAKGSGVYPLNISNLHSGNYLIRISSNDATVIGKLIIVK